MKLSRRSLAVSAATFSVIPPVKSIAQSSTPYATPQASPSTGEDGYPHAADRIRMMLDHTPQSDPDGFLDIYWTDMERHAAMFPDLAPWELTAVMPIGSLSDSPPMHRDLAPILGFEFDHILGSVHAWQPPNQIQIMELDVDVASLPSIWEGAAFERIDGDFGEYWTIGEDGEFDVDVAIQKTAQTRFNNIAILNERTLAFAPTAELLAGVVQESGDNQPSTLSQELDGLLDNFPKDAISTWLIDGDAFAFSASHPDESALLQALEESDAAVGPMPSVQAAATGITAGVATDPKWHHPDEIAYLLLQVDEPGQAAQAAEVVEWRFANLQNLENGEPYTNLFDTLEYEVVDENHVCVTADGIGAQFLRFVTVLASGAPLPLMYVQ